MKDHISAKEFKSLKTEHQIQTEIKNYLTAKGYKVIRLNSGTMPYEYTYKTGRRKGITRQGKMHLSEKGTPDLLVFKKCERCINDSGCNVYFIEVKRPGNKPTFFQEQMMQELESYGAICIIANSIESLREYIL